MKENPTIRIKLTRGKFAIVDADMAHLNEYKWHAVSAPNINNFYAARQYRFCVGKQRLIRMHHAIVGQPLNRSLVIDHRDGNPLNNVRENLFFVTKRDNSSNRKERRNGKTHSKYIGVTWNKDRKKWMSQIQIKGRNTYLGLFASEEFASLAYQKAKGDLV